MTQDTRDRLVLAVVVLLPIVVGLVLFFAGCASDPPAPIQAYRQMYGFDPVPQERGRD